MSRSRHTDPKRLLAARRICAPDEPRGSHNRTDHRNAARRHKELGLSHQPIRNRPALEAPLPEIRIHEPRPGHGFTVNRREITQVLRFFGAVCCYGLRAIELRHPPGTPTRGSLVLGRLAVPGRILLYDHPPSPWIIPGALPVRQAAWLRRAGAAVRAAGGGLQTIVDWPGNTLRDFILFDVLMHEIGHHLLQQYQGKRPARVARTRDHEAAAGRFARRCRDRFLSASQSE